MSEEKFTYNPIQNMLFYIFEYFRLEQEKKKGSVMIDSIFFSMLCLEQDIIYERIVDMNKDVFNDLKCEFDDRWEERKKEEKRGMNK